MASITGQESIFTLFLIKGTDNRQFKSFVRVLWNWNWNVFSERLPYDSELTRCFLACYSCGVLMHPQRFAL